MSALPSTRRGFLAAGSATIATAGAPLPALAAEPELAAAIAQYDEAGAAQIRAMDRYDAAVGRYWAMGGEPDRPDALFWREEDDALGLYGLAVYARGDNRRSFPERSIEIFRQVPIFRRIEERRPVTLADGYSQAEVDDGCYEVDYVKQPWPEAQARADEIVAAWDAWLAEDARRRHVSGLEAAWAEREAAFKVKFAADDNLARTPARTMVGLRSKAECLLKIYDEGGAAEFLEEALDDGRHATDMRLAASIAHDVMLMAGRLA